MKLSRPQEECGVFGVYNHPEASNLTYLGLYALQHRGQESCGIVSSDGSTLHAHKRMGLVADVFGNQEVFKKLPGKSAIGHVRYSTAGASVEKNVQPIMVDYSRGSIAVAHNGNLVNAQLLKAELEAYGSIFQTTMDTEIIIHLLAASKTNSLVDRIVDALKRIKGAYCLLFLTESRMIAVRDPNGFRPLCLGKLGSGWVVASESCALDLIEAEFVREIEPGEMIVCNADGSIESLFPFKKVEPTPCIFEFVYFARPDSSIFGKNVYIVRKELGRQLAREYQVEADVVIAVPDSGVPAAMGYAEESGIPFELGLIRNHYIGRTFIEPAQAIRHFGVKIKLNPVREILKGKRVVVIDDSIVRGTTSQQIIQMARDAGAKTVTFASAAPPVRFPHVYGINMPSRQELVAHDRTIPEIAEELGCDYLVYQEVDDLKAAILEGSDLTDLDMSCFDGRYVTGTVTEEYLSWVEGSQTS